MEAFCHTRYRTFLTTEDTRSAPLRAGYRAQRDWSGWLVPCLACFGGMLYYGRMRAFLIAICCVVAFTLAFAGDSKTSSDDRIYKVGSDVTAPKAILTPRPEPQELPEKKPGHKNKHATGVVVLSGYVGKDGKFHDAKVVRSAEPSLDSAALKAVAQWQFHPCMRKGVPVNCALGVEISFGLH